MEKEKAEFLLETLNGKDVLTFHFLGARIENQTPLTEFSAVSSFEELLELYGKQFPEDAIVLVDKREKKEAVK